MNQKRLMIIFGFFLLILPPGSATTFAEHMFDGRITFSQYLDIAQLTGENYAIKIDGNNFVIYYGYGGTFESVLKKENPHVSLMKINPEKKSLEVSFSDVPQESIMWLRLPLELISAEQEKFQVIIDGVETQYDLIKFPDDYAIGMMLPEGAQKLEIIGTYIIPEFGTISIAVFALSILSVLFLFQKKSQFLPV